MLIRTKNALRESVVDSVLDAVHNVVNDEYEVRSEHMRTEYRLDDGSPSLTGSPFVPGEVAEPSATAAHAVQDILSGRTFFPRDVFLHGVGLAGASARILSEILPEWMNRNGWREIANKLSAYRTFASAYRLLDRSADSTSLATAMNGIRKLDPYSAVWAMEGASYYYARQGGRLRTPEVDKLPLAARITLHTGAGLAWAEDALGSTPQSDVGNMLSDFWER